MRADEMKATELCRPTRNPTDGIYLIRDRRKVETLIRGLAKKGSKLESRDVWRLHYLRRGWVPFIRVTKRYSSDGKRAVDRIPTVVPPGYPVRRIQSPPPYRKRK